MKNSVIFLFLFIGGFSSGCQSTSMKFQKGRFLDATMDPSKTAPVSQTAMATPSQTWEKIESSGSSAVGSSCPTCGS